MKAIKTIKKNLDVSIQDLEVCIEDANEGTGTEKRQNESAATVPHHQIAVFDENSDRLLRDSGSNLLLDLDDDETRPVVSRYAYDSFI